MLQGLQCNRGTKSVCCRSPDQNRGTKSVILKIAKPLFLNKGFKSCRGRDRTSTRQLATVQSSVVDPGRIGIATNTALCCVYPVILTPETRGHVCQKFHHPTVCCSKNVYSAIVKQITNSLQIFQQIF